MDLQALNVSIITVVPYWYLIDSSVIVINAFKFLDDCDDCNVWLLNIYMIFMINIIHFNISLSINLNKIRNISASWGINTYYLILYVPFRSPLKLWYFFVKWELFLEV